MKEGRPHWQPSLTHLLPSLYISVGLYIFAWHCVSLADYHLMIYAFSTANGSYNVASIGTVESRPFLTRPKVTTVTAVVIYAV